MIDLRDKLQNVMPDAVWSLMMAVKDTAVSFNMPIYLIGGVLRDLLLETFPTDLDIIIEGDAIQVAKAVNQKFGGELVVHQAFGTAVWTLTPTVWQKITLSEQDVPIETIDFVTTRHETYEKPAALPKVTPSHLKDDLDRRDFTINAMGIRLDGPQWGVVIDPLGGLEDLKEGIIRVLHEQSFIDDPTRMLRAVRYAARFDFNFEPQTLALLKEAIPYFDETTGARLWHEFEWIFQEPHPQKAMMLLEQLGILDEIIEGLGWTDETAVAFQRANSQEVTLFAYFAMWMLGNPSEIETAVFDRFYIPNREQSRIRTLRKRLENLQRLPKNAKPSAVAPCFNELYDEELVVLLCLIDEPHQQQWLAQFNAKWKHIKPTVDGDALIRKGLKPGPHFKGLLDAIYAAWLDEVIVDQESETRFLDQLIASN